MKRLAMIALLSIAVLAGPGRPSTSAAAVTAGTWEVEYRCAPGMFGFVRDLDQLVQTIEQKSKLFLADLSVKLDGDTVKVTDGGRMYVYRFVGEKGLQIVRFSQLEEGRAAQAEPPLMHACS